MSTKNVHENLADHMAITDLVNRYTSAGNRRDWAALADTFAEDGVWKAIAPDGQLRHHAGRENVANALGALVEGMAMMVQFNHAVVIRVEGDHGRVVSTMEEYFSYPDGGPAMHAIGTYSDEVVRCADGEWRFAKRHFSPIYYEARAFPGTLAARH